MKRLLLLTALAALLLPQSMEAKQCCWSTDRIGLIKCIEKPSTSCPTDTTEADCDKVDACHIFSPRCCVYTYPPGSNKKILCSEQSFVINCDDVKVKPPEASAKTVESACNKVSDCAAFSEAPLPPPEAPVPFAPVAPRLNVDIPGLSLPDFLKVKTEGEYVFIPFIAVYFAALYRFAIGAAAVLAVIMIMIGGFRWIVAGGGPQIGEAKKMITNAVIGLFIAVGSYVILSLINPDLVAFKALKIKTVVGVPLQDIEEDVEVSAPGGEGLVPLSSIPGYTSTALVDRKMIPDLTKVAQDMTTQSLKIVVSPRGGNRTVQQQLDIINEKIANNSCLPDASTKFGYKCTPPVCLAVLKNPTPTVCPHTSGYAIDAWGSKDGATQCISWEACKADISTCRKDPCQKALIDIMHQNGFCNLCSEPWHFEKPKVSSGCTC